MNCNAKICLVVFVTTTKRLTDASVSNFSLTQTVVVFLARRRAAPAHLARAAAAASSLSALAPANCAVGLPSTKEIKVGTELIFACGRVPKSGGDWRIKSVAAQQQRSADADAAQRSADAAQQQRD